MSVQHPSFINPDEGKGWNLTMLPQLADVPWWQRPFKNRRLYEFDLNPDTPLTYHDHNGLFWQPDRHYITDLGSVPALVQWLPYPRISKDGTFVLPFLIHDSAYQAPEDGGRGLYVSELFQGPYRWRPMTRLEADRMLEQMVRAVGGRCVESALIYRAVRMFGPRWRGMT